MFNEIMEFLDDALYSSNDIAQGVVSINIWIIIYWLMKNVVIPKTKKVFGNRDHSLIVRAFAVALVPWAMAFLIFRAVWLINMGEPMPRFSLVEIGFIILMLRMIKQECLDSDSNGSRTLSGRTGEAKVIHKTDDQSTSNPNFK